MTVLSAGLLGPGDRERPWAAERGGHAKRLLPFRAFEAAAKTGLGV